MGITVPNQHTSSDSTPIILDVARTLELLQAVVNEVGYDHQYDGPYREVDPDELPDIWVPRYVDDQGDPACIVARALADAGVPAEVLARFEGVGANKLLAQLAGEGVLVYSVEAAIVLTHAQEEQDDHRTWGRAVASARALLAEDVTSC